MIKRLNSDSVAPAEESTYDRVVDEIERRWVSPNPGPDRIQVDADKIDSTARAVLDAMLTRPWRISKLPSEEDYAELLAKVTHWVRRGKPVRITIGYAPMKNLNVARESRADWSEFFALTHLCAWFNKVQAVYPPGLRIKIIFDDSTVAMANRPDRRHMNNYISSIGRLIKTMHYDRFIVGTSRQSSFAWLFNFGLYQWAARRVRRFDRDPANHEVVEQMLTFARRNMLLPQGLKDDERERLYRDASFRYRVYWEALQLSGFTKLGKHIIGMYLDGKQHHIKQQAALHLATLGKEQVTQPWQGEGGLKDNNKGKLVPLVLTGGRLAQLDTEEVSGLSLVSLPGFESIQVCRDKPK